MSIGKISEAERVALDHALSVASAEAGQEFSLNGLMRKWAAFVTEVERGYEASIYEYINDLAVRRVLEKVAVSIPTNLREKILLDLEVWDSKFFRATQKVATPLFGRNEISGPRIEYWNRIPLTVGGELEEDLRDFLAHQENTATGTKSDASDTS